jgi:hypothetical protein
MAEANTDPDPIRIQGFNDQKLKKITAENFLNFFLYQKLQLKYGSGSTLLIENGSNTDPDPQP